MALVDVLAGEGYSGEGTGYQPAAALGQGAVFSIGYRGDYDPGRVLDDIEIHNYGTVDLWVARTLSDVLTAQGERWRVVAGGSRFLAGSFATLVIHNVAASGATALWDIQAMKSHRLNQGAMRGHPGHGEHIVRVVAVQNDYAEYEVLVGRDSTMTAVKPFSAAKNTSAGGGVLLTVKRQRGTVNLLSASTYDLEGLTNGVIASVTLTATTANLALDVGDVVLVRVTSDNVDMVEGDLAVALGMVPR